MTARRTLTTVALRAAIDAEFARMASNRAYQQEAVQVEEELAETGWEALRAAERSA